VAGVGPFWYQSPGYTLNRTYPGEAMEDRLTTLEIRYTHLELHVEELNQLLIDQQKVIDRLTREVAILRASTSGVESGTQSEPPPHY
jgi:uncharacterized coiled-coil protein SlyX